MVLLPRGLIPRLAHAPTILLLICVLQSLTSYQCSAMQSLTTGLGCTECLHLRFVQDRIASLNGRTVQLVIRQDKPAFIRLIGISVLQSAASAVLAPSLRYVADALALTWRKRLTAAAHTRYFKGNTFYTTSQLAGGRSPAQSVADTCILLFAYQLQGFNVQRASCCGLMLQKGWHTVC